MKTKLISTISLSFFLFFAIGQNKLEYQGNFKVQEYLEEHGESSTPLGFFVKGNKGDIIELCHENNGQYRSSVKGWHYVKIPANKFKAFNSNNSILSTHISMYKGVALNDTMRVNNRVNNIHSGNSPLSQAYTGEGVIIGFIDTGIDWEHGDFKNADGSTRIMSLWDQTLGTGANTPAAYGYGQHWDSTEINLGLPTTNTSGTSHGSTVSGCAAGNGLANGTHMGVAPNVDLIVVENNLNAADWLSTVVDATEYIYHIADSIGKPCVINGSIGTYFGSHDGFDPYSLYIDSLIQSKRGHLFVCSAGNSGDWGPYHLHANINNDTTFTWFKPHSSWGYVFAELWADTAAYNQIQYSMGADMNSPYYSHRGQGQYFDIASNINAPSSLLYDTIRNTNGDQIATIMYYAEQMDGQYMVQAYIPYADSTSYYYRFQTKGSGSYDIWSEQAHLDVSDIVPEDQLPTTLEFPEITMYSPPDTLSTMVSSFQCLPSTITVANYWNDSGWVNNLGNWVSQGSSIHRGMLSSTSSKGPTRTGLMKPDIAASGDNTFSSCPLDLIPIIGDAALAYGGMHKVNGGTSMASPVVAGIAALYLEKCNMSGPNDFKDRLINSAYSDQWTGTLPNFAFGYGKVDGFNTLVNSNFSTSILNNEFCSGEDSTEVSTFLNYLAYEWSSGDLSESSFYGSSSDEYLIVTDTAGCKSDTSYFPVIENPLPPTPTITINFDNLNADAGYNNYQWYANNILLNGENDSILSVSVNGTYQVEVFDANGCSSLSDTTYYGAVSIEEFDQNIQLYPVPAYHNITINSQSLLVKYVLLNSNGQIVKSKDFNNQDFATTIDLAYLARGLYLLEIITEEGIILKKFNKL